MRYLKGFFKIFVFFLDLYNSFFQYFQKDVYVVLRDICSKTSDENCLTASNSWKILRIVFWTSVFGNVVKRSLIFDELLLYPQVSERINLLFVSQSIIKLVPIFMSSSYLDGIDVHQSQVQSWPLTSRNVTADKYNQSENENFDPYEIWYLPNLL